MPEITPATILKFEEKILRSALRGLLAETCARIRLFATFLGEDNCPPDLRDPRMRLWCIVSDEVQKHLKALEEDDAHKKNRSGG